MLLLFKPLSLTFRFTGTTSVDGCGRRSQEARGGERPPVEDDKAAAQVHQEPGEGDHKDRKVSQQIKEKLPFYLC